MRGGMRGRGGVGTTGGSGRSGQEARPQLTRLLEAPARLSVVQTEGSIAFTDGDGRSWTFATTNKKEKHPYDGRTVDVKTRWTDGRLIKETTFEGGLKTIETYTTVAVPSQLHVTVKLEGNRLPHPITVRRVYDVERPQ
jgi:hypothetical protein